jgi:hypothetical protein
MDKTRKRGRASFKLDEECRERCLIGPITVPTAAQEFIRRSLGRSKLLSKLSRCGLVLSWSLLFTVPASSFCEPSQPRPAPVKPTHLFPPPADRQLRISLPSFINLPIRDHFSHRSPAIAPNCTLSRQLPHPSNWLRNSPRLFPFTLKEYQVASSSFLTEGIEK